MDNGRLGKGLDSLLDEDTIDQPPENESDDPPSSQSTLRDIPVDSISPNPHQPRNQFSEEELASLAQSIRSEGVLQPVLVTPNEDGETFTLAAGERRFRAAQRAELEEIPAVVRPLNDQRLLEIALVENIQREELNPIEEAQALDHLYHQFDMNLNEIADITGKSTSSISNSRRLLNLEDDLQDYVKEGLLTGGHARTLLSLSNPEDRRSAAKTIVDNELSVRNAEKLVKSIQEEGADTKTNDTAQKSTDQSLPPELESIQERFEEKVGTRVQIKTQKNGGSIQIDYQSSEELSAILERLDISPPQ